MNTDGDIRQYYYLDGYNRKRLLKKAIVQKTIFLDENNREIAIPLCEIRYDEKVEGSGMVVEKRL